MKLPTHTPFDGSTKPFTIGLKPLDLADWIEIDATFEDQLAEKRRLYATVPEKVFVAEPDTLAAQREVLDLIIEHLPRRFPDLYSADPDAVLVGGQPVPIGDATAPLRAASLLIQEDLILMRRGDLGWRLVAGSLFFPSSWSLAEKFGKPIHEIHRPVPDFGPGTRMADLIARMFDRLQPGNPVQRFNWSVQSGDALYHPLSNEGRIDRAVDPVSKFPGGEIAAHAFIRVERQTLRKLPVSGDILFTIRIYLDPLAVLRKHEDRAALAASFAAQLDALDAAQLAYKGMTADRDRLVAILQAMGSAGRTC